MLPSIVYCFIIASIGPLLLFMHWVQSNFPAVTIANTRYDVTIKHHLPNRPCQIDHIIPKPAYCNSNLSKEERVRSLIHLLTTDEKISLLGHDSPSINRPEVYLPAYKWWNEGLHGLAWTDCCPPHLWKNVTVFPQVIGLAMTWNRSLWNEVGSIIGGQALQHRNSGGKVPGLTYFTPNINIFRDPRWGRGQETPGEDPFLTSHYAAVMVTALQYGREFYHYLVGQGNAEMESTTMKPRVAATCKHWAAYSLETGRFNFSADIDKRDWDDTYTPAFDACIHAEEFLLNHLGKDRSKLNGSGSLGVMCSYNAINGTPSCANRELLDRLRQDWEFKGYVVSDCWAIANIFEHHHYVNSYQEAVGMALRAGVDLDCGDTVQKYGVNALEQNYMSTKDVDRALSNLLGVLLELGYFDEDFDVFADLTSPQKESADEVALEAALQSIVLLKNGQNSDLSSCPLPLLTSKHKAVTVIGPLADNAEAMLANYHGIPSQVITPVQGLKDLGVEVTFICGCNVTNATNEIEVDELCQHFNANNDATILVVGLDQTIESEEIDRTSLLLPKVQRDVIKVATRCSKLDRPDVPVLLIVITGGPIDLSEYKNNNDIDAILYTSYPGQAGGTALADVLYGKYNPSGRLVTTMYANSYLDNVPLHDMRMRPIHHERYPGRTYRFYGGNTVYSFGYGLSYSTWEYKTQLDEEEYAVEVNVSNTGSFPGSTPVLLFHEGPTAGRRENPIRSLIGFEKVFVPAHESRMVIISFAKDILSEEGEHVISMGPSTENILRAYR